LSPAPSLKNMLRRHCVILLRLFSRVFGNIANCKKTHCLISSSYNALLFALTMYFTSNYKFQVLQLLEIITKFIFMLIKSLIVYKSYFLLPNLLKHSQRHLLMHLLTHFLTLLIHSLFITDQTCILIILLSLF